MDLFNRLIFVSAILSILLNEVTSDLNRDLEWLSFCPGGDGKKYIVHDTAQCPLGIYFKSSYKDLCVCGNGVWKLSTEVCGHNWIIDAEDGDCFEVPASSAMRWIRYLGHAHEPKREFNFVTDQTMTHITPMSESGYTDGGYSTVVTVNPRRAMSDCNNEVCYKMGKTIDASYQPGEPPPRVMWADVPKDLGMYATPACNPHPTISAKQFAKGIPRRGSFYNSDSENTDTFLRHVPSEKCRKRCLPQFGNISFDDTIWGDGRIVGSHGVLEISQITRLVANESMTHFDKMDNTTAVGPNSTFPFMLTHKEECKLKPTPNITPKKLKDLAAQTQRMAEAHYDAVILGKRAPLIVMPEFEYLRTGRLIFEKVCPAAEVQPTLLKSLLVLFRIALNESLSRTPYEHLGDAEEDTRLKASLDMCLKRAETKHFKISYNTTTCPAQFDGFFLERTTPGPQPLDPNVPCDVAHVPNKFDYPVEAAWKLGMFTHYFCAQHFNATAFDHSRLEYKLRQLFNKDMITRWYHPGLAGKVFQHIFHEFDMDKFLAGMDRCVAGAKFLSPYANWIKRPKFEGGIPSVKADSKASDAPTVLKGMGRCLTKPEQVKQMGQRCMADIKPPTCSAWASTVDTSENV